MSLKEAGRSVGYVAEVAEDLLSGAHLVRRAFIGVRSDTIEQGTALIPDVADPGAFLIARGVAYRSVTFRDGRRSILDVLLPGDIAGLENIVRPSRQQEITAANDVSGYALAGPALRELLARRATAARLFALMAEDRERMGWVVASIGRQDARERIARFVLDIYDRLRRRELIAGVSFNLPLTQEQIGDHLGLTVVHVNRTLRQMREDGLLLVSRGVVIVMDPCRLRALADPGRTFDDMPNPGALAPERQKDFDLV